MASKLVRVILALGAIAGQHNVCRAASWLDEPKPASWNKPGEPIPAAPKYPDGIDPRCQIQARSPKLPEDKRLHNLGWDLIGPYQGGDRALVIGATADYDGMCRPSSYQYFVFVRGIFAGDAEKGRQARGADLLQADEADAGDGLARVQLGPEGRGQQPLDDGGIGAEIHQ